MGYSNPTLDRNGLKDYSGVNSSPVGWQGKGADLQPPAPEGSADWRQEILSQPLPEGPSMREGRTRFLYTLTCGHSPPSYWLSLFVLVPLALSLCTTLEGERLWRDKAGGPSHRRAQATWQAEQPQQDVPVERESYYVWPWERDSGESTLSHNVDLKQVFFPPIHECQPPWDFDGLDMQMSLVSYVGERKSMIYFSAC